MELLSTAKRPIFTSAQEHVTTLTLVIAMKNLVGLFLMASLSTSLGSSATDVSIYGYRVNVVTIIYDDLSVARQFEYRISADIFFSLEFERKLLEERNYKIHTTEIDEDKFLIAKAIHNPTNEYLNVYEDVFSTIQVEKENGKLVFHETFKTDFLQDKIDQSDLKDDLETAKIMMSDLRYDFISILYGKVTETSGGDFYLDTAKWSFDVEGLFNNASLSMGATSTIERHEQEYWIVAGIGFGLILIGFLMLMRYGSRRAGNPTVHENS